MNRIEILILDRRNGVICNEYADAQSVLSFFHRTGHINRFQVVVRKTNTNKAIYFDKVDITTFAREVHNFQTQR